MSVVTLSESVTGPVDFSGPTETSLLLRELKIFIFWSSVTGLTVGIYKEKQEKAVVLGCNKKNVLKN